MATVYPAYQHPSPHSLDDDMHVFDGYGAALGPDTNTNAMVQGTPGMNPYGMLTEAGTRWGQWWSPGDISFANSANVTAPNVYGQEPQFNQPNSALDQDTSTQWDSPSSSAHSYPVPSPLIDATSLDISPGHESRRGSYSTQTDQRKRKRSTASVAKTKVQSPATKSTKRASTRKASKAEPAPAVSEKPRRGSRSKATAKSQQPSSQEQEEYEDEDADADPEEEYDIHSKKVQERNRIASNKFRVKKREDAIKLRADEEDMERANRDLTNCVSDLTLQVYELKMKLLQHTDCDCTLIQDYIATEAQRYIKDLGDGKHPNATPALPPSLPSQHMYHQHHQHHHVQ